MTKTILVRDWRKMETAFEPTSTTGKIKKDENGNLWLWVAGGKRITAKRYIIK